MHIFLTNVHTILFMSIKNAFGNTCEFGLKECIRDNEKNICEALSNEKDLNSSKACNVIASILYHVYLL